MEERKAVRFYQLASDNMFARNKAFVVAGFVLFIVATLFLASVLISERMVMLSPGDESGPLMSDGFIIVLFLVIAGLFGVQILMFLSVQRMKNLVGESREEFSVSLNELKGAERDEFKEMVMTRNELMTKLIKTTDEIEKLRKKRKS